MNDTSVTAEPLDGDHTTDTEAACSERERIDVSAPLHEKADRTIDALISANDPDEPEVMVRGTALIRTTERATLEAYSVPSLQDRISRAAQFERQTERGLKDVPDPPRSVVEAVLARDSSEYADLPRVDVIVDVPVLGPNGSIISRRGHHPSSSILYQPASGLADIHPPEPDSVDDQEVRWARDLLLEDLLGDFVFEDQSSRANALALVLTPFVRPFIDGPTPLFVINAHEPGWGKGTLTDATLMPGCGVVPKSPGARDEDEWRKRITSALVGAPSAVVFDNLGPTLGSQALAQALTEQVWSDRILGISKNFVGEIRNVWLANGNNLGLSDEIADRTVPIRLGPTADQAAAVTTPRMRPASEWEHPNIREWARDNRRSLALAALTLVQRWLDGRVTLRDPETGSEMRDPDQRAFPARTMGSFEAWSRTVGGILKAADIEGFLENRERLASDMAESSGDGTVEFLAAWHELGNGPMTSRQLAAACTFGGGLLEYLPDELMNVRSEEMQKRLSYWLRNVNGRWIDGQYRVRSEGTGRNSKRWKVTPAA